MPLFNSYQYPRRASRQQQRNSNSTTMQWFSCGPTTTTIAKNSNNNNANTGHRQRNALNSGSFATITTKHKGLKEKAKDGMGYKEPRVSGDGSALIKDKQDELEHLASPDICGSALDHTASAASSEITAETEIPGRLYSSATEASTLASSSSASAPSAVSVSDTTSLPVVNEGQGQGQGAGSEGANDDPSSTLSSTSSAIPIPRPTSSLSHSSAPVSSPEQSDAFLSWSPDFAYLYPYQCSYTPYQDTETEYHSTDDEMRSSRRKYHRANANTRAYPSTPSPAPHWQNAAQAHQAVYAPAATTLPIPTPIRSPTPAVEIKPVLVPSGADLYWSSLKGVPAPAVSNKTGEKLFAFETFRTLEGFQSRHEICFALRGALRALQRWLHTTEGDAHANINPQTIRICPEKMEGLHIHVPSGDIDERKSKTLNFKYMSVSCLEQMLTEHAMHHSNSSYVPVEACTECWFFARNIRPEQRSLIMDYLDDLESVYYTICFICVYFIGPACMRPAGSLPPIFHLWEEWPCSWEVLAWKKECLLSGRGIEEGEVSAYFGAPFVKMLSEMREVLEEGYRRKMGFPMRSAQMRAEVEVEEKKDQEQEQPASHAEKEDEKGTKVKDVWEERIMVQRMALAKHALASAHSRKTSSSSSSSSTASSSSSPSGSPSSSSSASSTSSEEYSISSSASDTTQEEFKVPQSDIDFRAFFNILYRGCRSLSEHSDSGSCEYLDALQAEKEKYDAGLDERVFFDVDSLCDDSEE
ncbi:hypothetical protein D9613_004285 [Agrocybe pediades]|uniref:Fungal-type protein kinase domain-containing protein n=1 Tax=Agrocybe pediades TaxID=84607 RepID=A0A8H4QJB4_9AGAR|nr:hypothetical protein D9613_004285 [Agrocybe pediades]